MLVIGADGRRALDTDALVSAIRRCAAVSAVATPLTDSQRRDDERSRNGHGGDELVRASSPAGEPMAISHDEDTVAVSVVAFYGVPLARVVEQIETAVRPLIGARVLHVTITDLDDTRRGRPEA